jgi:hypothetical protein
MPDAVDAAYVPPARTRTLPQWGKPDLTDRLPSDALELLRMATAVRRLRTSRSREGTILVPHTVHLVSGASLPSCLTRRSRMLEALLVAIVLFPAAKVADVAVAPKQTSPTFRGPHQGII